jgi:drug/metabolite transporter (DMT)-like permease
MPEAAQSRIKGILLLTLALVCFSFLDTCAKLLNPVIGPGATVWTRYAVSVLVVFVFINPWTTPDVMRSNRPWLQALRSLLLLGSTVGNFYALQYLQLSETITIMFVAPLIVALAAGPILGEWVGPRRLIAIGVGFIGVLIVTRPGMGSMHWAALLTLAGAFCYAFYSILTRILAAHDRSATTMVWSGLAGVILLLPFAPQPSSLPSDPVVITLMVVMGLLGAAGHALLILAHRHAPASVLAPFGYSQLIWMVALGYLVFHDVPDRWTMIGAAVVIASGLYLLHRERVTNTQGTPPA